MVMVLHLEYLCSGPHHTIIYIKLIVSILVCVYIAEIVTSYSTVCFWSYSYIFWLYSENMYQESNYNYNMVQVVMVMCRLSGDLHIKCIAGIIILLLLLYKLCNVILYSHCYDLHCVYAIYSFMIDVDVHVGGCVNGYNYRGVSNTVLRQFYVNTVFQEMLLTSCLHS